MKRIDIALSVDEWHGFEVDGVQYDLNLYADLNNNIQATIYRCTKNENGTWTADTENEKNLILNCASAVDLEIVTDKNNPYKEQEWVKNIT